MSEQRERRARPATKSTSKRASGSKADHAVDGPEEAARRACRSLARLITHETEGVSAVRRAEDGWRVNVDVLEVPRIPDTTSLLATYAVELDNGGRLVEYERIRRYRRGARDD
ncbi:gas vesicle protein [Streptomyces sp. NBC_01808]|uniref:gas vesicle protein GvpO n=1 Tax=Streptomyces sp. NBC_01808 TaxID=2975947 RepID=UPI002DD94A24|nr:gas vesicle protein GvpO [Streptomyces sp. NBC_01808]WSA42077.1 gas vesicle protein [Streptomyces sp. NBC_01808]